GGEGVREMTDLREQAIVIFRRATRDPHRQIVTPESFHSSERRRIGAIRGREDAQRVAKKISASVFDAALLAPGHRMTADESAAKMRRQLLLGELNERPHGAAEVDYVRPVF